MSSDKAYAVEQRLDTLVGQLSHATNGEAEFASARVTQASLTSIATGAIAAKDPDAGAVYRLTAWLHGTWGSSTQQLTIQNQLKGSQGTTNLAQVVIGANLFPVSQPFRLRVVCEWWCQSTGANGRWFGPLHGEISAYNNSLLAADGANGSLGFAGENFTPNGQDTTQAMTPTLALAWQATAGGPTVTKDYSMFQRIT